MTEPAREPDKQESLEALALPDKAAERTQRLELVESALQEIIDEMTSRLLSSSPSKASGESAQEKREKSEWSERLGARNEENLREVIRSGFLADTGVPAELRRNAISFLATGSTELMRMSDDMLFRSIIPAADLKDALENLRKD